MLSSKEFWAGALIGVVAVYVWHKYQMKKSGS